MIQLTPREIELLCMAVNAYAYRARQNASPLHDNYNAVTDSERLKLMEYSDELSKLDYKIKKLDANWNY